MGFGRGAHRLSPGAADITPVPPERRARTVRRIAAFFGPYRLQVGVVLVAILATSLLGLINPYLLKLLIDDVIVGRRYDLLDLYVGLMIAVPIGSGLIGIGQTYLNNVIGQSVMQDLRNALYAHLQRMPLRFFTETRTGEIQSRLANDVGGVQAVVTDTASSVTSNLAIAISTIVAMLLIDWRLTVLSLGLLPFFLLLTYRVGRIRREVSGETQKQLAELTATTEETLSVSGMLLSKTFGQQAAATDRFRRMNRQLAILQIRQAMVGRWFFMIIGTIFSITPAFVYWLAAVLASHGDPSAPTAGDIVAFTTLQSRLFFPMGQLLNVQVEIQGALALFDRIFEYLDMDPEIVDAPDAVALDPAGVAGRVRLHRVSFRYPTAAVHSSRALAIAAEGHRHIADGEADAEPAPAQRPTGGVGEAGDLELVVDGADASPAAARVLEEVIAGSEPAVGAATPPLADGAAPPRAPARPAFALRGIDLVGERGELV
ncbi:MAG TPA: ABC transporter ATP-binding protein, partial [Candidatus Dormibacteraeota bacterium]|nr:ABC transporter ATP-binding protein [Candidatus Dormibacteraeota bacterium]